MRSPDQDVFTLVVARHEELVRVALLECKELAVAETRDDILAVFKKHAVNS